MLPNWVFPPSQIDPRAPLEAGGTEMDGTYAENPEESCNKAQLWTKQKMGGEPMGGFPNGGVNLSHFETSVCPQGFFGGMDGWVSTQKKREDS